MYLGNSPKDPISVSTDAPSNPKNGAVWFNSALGETFVYYDDGDTAQWVQTNPAGQQGPSGPTGPAGANGEVVRTELDAYLQVANLSSLSTSIIPSANVTYDLGSTTNYWKDLYLSGNTIFLGTSQITLNASGGIDLPSASRMGGTLIGSGSGGGASVYTALSDLPMSGNDTGAQAYVSGTNRLYLWNGTGWYNIALINTNPTISGASASYSLNTDGSNTVVTLAASDPEGLPITFTATHTGLGVGANAIAVVTQSNNIFTFTPTTNTALVGTFTTTFTASDGVNLAGANSSFTLAFSVNNSNYTTALITSVGANNADNNDFVDSSTNSHTITAAGDATQTTFSPYRHGGYSTYFDGTGDYLEIDDGTWLTLGNGNFCFETWIYNAVSTGSSQYIFGQGNSSGTAAGVSVELYITASRTLSGGIYVGSQKYATSTGTIPTNTWTHVALVRNGSNIQLYINGTKDGENTSAGTDSAVDQSTHFSIGRAGEYNGLYFNGYITDFRFVNGSSVHTGNFTSPTERLTAITNTSLLACHLPYIADGSTNDHSITINGNTKTEPFAPYDYGTYASSNHGGSMYFDGTGDYLSIADHADLDMGSSDFTIEGWYYPVVTAGGMNGLLSKRANSSEANGVLIYFGGTSTGEPSLLVAQSGSWTINTASSITFKTGQWNHFAIVRNGTSFKLYINGKAGVSVTSSITVTDNGHAFIIGAMGADGSNPLAESNIADFRVVKGTAVYTAEFTPPTAPLTTITNTKLLVQSTDAGIIDKSQSVKTITLNGDVKSSTTQTKYLTSSMYFDGSGDYLSVPYDAGFNMGATTDFTMEAWVYQINQTGNHTVFAQYNGTGTAHSEANGHRWIFWIDDGRVQLYQYPDMNTQLIDSGTLNLNTWNHVAATREGSVFRLFVNGTQVDTVTSSTVEIGFLNDPLTVGSYNSTGYFNGYMSDVRITKGLARYTSSFTPPTAALQG